MKVSTEIDNNFGYEKITQLVDNIPLTYKVYQTLHEYKYTREQLTINCVIQIHMWAINH